MKIFNHQTSPQRAGTSRPGIGVYTTNGSIGINAAAIKILNLKKGDAIQFAQDEEDPTLWYLSVSPVGYRLNMKKGGESMFICSKTVSRAIRSVLCNEYDKDKAIRLVFGEPKKADGITWYSLKKAYG